MKPDLVSIIIPTYNSEQTLSACLESIKQQEYSNIEVVIVDGVSKDGTVELAYSFSKKFPSIQIISEKDKGIYDAMNKGVKHATGEWLIFLGSDDKLYSPDILQRIFTKDLSDVDVIYGNVYSPFFNGVYNGKYTVEKLLEKNICHQAIFFRKRVFDEVGLFNIRYKLHADWDHNLRWFVSKKIRHLYVDEIIAYYGEGGTSSVQLEPFFYKIMQWNYLVYNRKEFSFFNKLRIARSELVKAVKDNRRRDTLKIIKEFPTLFF